MYKNNGRLNITFIRCSIGLFSVIMREQANIPNSCPKWILLDGDIDPMWIESLNTVMDDNKVLLINGFLKFF